MKKVKLITFLLTLVISLNCCGAIENTNLSTESSNDTSSESSNNSSTDSSSSRISVTLDENEESYPAIYQILPGQSIDINGLPLKFNLYPRRGDNDLFGIPHYVYGDQEYIDADGSLGMYNYVLVNGDGSFIIFEEYGFGLDDSGITRTITYTADNSFTDYDRTNGYIKSQEDFDLENNTLTLHSFGMILGSHVYATNYEITDNGLKQNSNIIRFDFNGDIENIRLTLTKDLTIYDADGTSFIEPAGSSFHLLGYNPTEKKIYIGDLEDLPCAQYFTYEEKATHEDCSDGFLINGVIENGESCQMDEYDVFEFLPYAG